MKIAGSIFASLLAAGVWATPAHADIAGRYETVDDDTHFQMEMTFEVDDVGNVRIQQGGSPSYYLLRDGEFYLVGRENGEPSVIRLSDAMVIAGETFDRMGARDAFDEVPEFEPFNFSEMGPQTVSGRTGMAYGIVSDGNDEPVWASLVIGDDPRLAPLGRAMAEAQASQVSGMGSLGTMLQNLSGNMQEVLNKGAPLRWMSIELTDVSFDEIPAERFALPSEPISLEELRAASEPAPPPPTLPPRED